MTNSSVRIVVIHVAKKKILVWRWHIMDRKAWEGEGEENVG